MNTLPTHIEWIGPADGGHLRLLDQTKLPGQVTYLDCRSVQDVWDAIKRLSVRGAPAIGIAAAYSCVIAHNEGDFEKLTAHLATSRPTAVNLFWAIERMKRVPPEVRTPEKLLAEAMAIHEEDRAMCQAIGEHALPLLQEACGESGGVLTHCNAGALATGGIGTATAAMYLAQQRGLKWSIYADETRPLLQGARLTAWELSRAGIDVTLICDDMAATVMRRGKVQAVITGADRIAANGDAANKIGTYNLAVLARHHGIPFYVAAPTSTFDRSIPDGSHIPIEQRDGSEIAQLPGVKTFNPAFDVTPRELITAIITEQGVE
ncbi:MAG: S-methyl-5-thioribose-1-phosphate isomerase [Phycisphaeraceae bacterium]|nr:S-methyl-5-thioribose-1-phosphate isomerase [Phycisphaeraceae bacterium]